MAGASHSALMVSNRVPAGVERPQTVDVPPIGPNQKSFAWKSQVSDGKITCTLLFICVYIYIYMCVCVI